MSIDELLLECAFCDEKALLREGEGGGGGLQDGSWLLGAAERCAALEID